MRTNDSEPYKNSKCYINYSANVNISRFLLTEFNKITFLKCSQNNCPVIIKMPCDPAAVQWEKTIGHTFTSTAGNSKINVHRLNLIQVDTCRKLGRKAGELSANPFVTISCEQREFNSHSR